MENAPSFFQFVTIGFMLSLTVALAYMMLTNGSDIVNI